MLPLLTIVLPIFGLIAAGWVARRTGVLGPGATTELNRFVVYLALPALLFDIVANAALHEIWQPAFVAAFGLGAMAVFAIPLALAAVRRRPLADAAINALNAGYSNTGFIGFPLALATLGTAALAPTVIATLITVCVVFALALLLVEVALQTEAQPARLVAKVALSLARNPLILAPAVGAVCLVLGVRTPAMLENFLKPLGSAASPCALVALGLFLGEKRGESKPAVGDVAALVALKLAVHPLITWLLAAFVFRLPPPTVAVAVLMAALPTGTGPFMVAEFYRLDAGLTARVILVSTILSILTVTACLIVFGGRPS